MTEKDAAMGRKLMVDELNTINEYKGMAANADDAHTKKVLDDVAEEEKIHVGEGAELVDRNDSTARPTMKEGFNEATHIEESAKQMHFSELTGNMTSRNPNEPPPKLYNSLAQSQFTNPSKTPAEKKAGVDKAKEIDRENLTDKAYENKWRETKTGKSLKSARDVFAEKRAEVVAKANGLHIEKDANWKHAGPEAVDYVEQKKMPNTEFLRMTDHPMGSIESYREANGPLEDGPGFRNKPDNAIYGSKYTPTKNYDSGWKEFTETEDFMDRNEGEIYTVHPDSRGLIIHTPEEYRQFLDKYLQDGVKSPEEVERELDRMGYSGGLRDRMRRDLENKHPSYVRAAQDYDWIYFPDPKGSGIQGSSFTSAPILDVNSLIMLNDYLQDGKTPTRILQRPYTPRNERIAQGQQDDSRHDYVPEKDVPLGFMAEGGREPSKEEVPAKAHDVRQELADKRASKQTDKKNPKVRHEGKTAETKGLVDRDGKKKENAPKEKTPEQIAADEKALQEDYKAGKIPTVPREEVTNKRMNHRRSRIDYSKDKNRQKKVSMTGQKELNVQTPSKDNEIKLDQALSKLSPKQKNALLEQLKRMKNSTYGVTARNVPTPKKTTKKSASQETDSQEHFAKKRSFGAESRKKVNNDNNKKASPRQSYALGVGHNPFKGYYNTNDPAYRLKYKPGYSAMRHSGDLYVTPDPTEFSMENYRRYNTMGGGNDRLPVGNITDENYTTLGGTPGGTQQVTPNTVQATDMHGNPVYDEVRTPKLMLDDNGQPIPVKLDDGSVVWMPMVDENGQIVYETTRKPRYVQNGNLILTRKGKDMAYLQRHVGRLDTNWDQKTQQWVPVGLQLDKNGEFPDELFQGITDEYGNIDPVKAMTRLRQLGYSGKDNRWTPDTSADVEDFYLKEAYRQLVNEGIIGPDMKVPRDDPSIQQAIITRAEQIRAEDDEREKKRQNDLTARRKELFDAEEDLLDEAYEESMGILEDWLDNVDAEMDGKGGFVVHKVGPDGNEFDISLPKEHIDAWVDTNALAIAERNRKENIRSATDEEKATLERARRGDSLTAMVAQYYLHDLIKGLGHDPSPDEMEDLGERVHRIVEKMPFEQKAQVVEHIRNRDWANVKDTMENLPLYMHPDDIYHQSRAHEEDLARMREDAKKYTTQADRDLFYVDKLREVQQLSEKLKNSDPDMKFIQSAIMDLRDGSLGVTETKFGPRLIYKGVDDPSRKHHELALIQKLLKENGMGVADILNMPEPNKALGKMVQAYNKAISKDMLYRAANQMGISPKGFDSLVQEAGAATHRQRLGGNDLSKIKDDDLRWMFDDIITNQGAFNGLGSLVDDIRTEYGSGRALTDDDKDTILEDVINNTLGKIRDNMVGGRYLKRYGQDSSDYKQLNKFVNDMSDDAQRKYLGELYSGKMTPGGLHLSYDLENMFRNGMNKEFKDSTKEHVLRYLMGMFGEKAKDILGRSSAIDAAQVDVPAKGESLQADTPPAPTKDRQRAEAESIIARLDRPRTLDDRKLRLAMDTTVKMLKKGGAFTDEEIHDMLVDALVAGNLKTFNTKKIFGTLNSVVTPEQREKEKEINREHPTTGTKPRTDSAGNLLDPTEVDEGLSKFEGMTAEEVERAYNDALDYVSTHDDKSDPDFITAWDTINAVENELKNPTSPGAEKPKNGLQMYRSKLETDAQLKTSRDAQEKGITFTENPDKSAYERRQRHEGTTGGGERYGGNHARGAEGDTPIGDEPKPLRPRPKAADADGKDEKGDEKKDGQVDETKVTPTDKKDEHKEASMRSARDVFADKRNKVLKKYRGI